MNYRARGAPRLMPRRERFVDAAGQGQNLWGGIPWPARRWGARGKRSLRTYPTEGGRIVLPPLSGDRGYPRRFSGALTPVNPDHFTRVFLERRFLHIATPANLT